MKLKSAIVKLWLKVYHCTAWYCNKNAPYLHKRRNKELLNLIYYWPGVVAGAVPVGAGALPINAINWSSFGVIMISVRLF